MDLYMVSYYPKGGASYRRFAAHVAGCGAVRLHRTLWVMPTPKDWAGGMGTAGMLRDTLQPHIGEHDALAVIELVEGIDWATHNALPSGLRRLRNFVGGSDRNVTQGSEAEPP